MHRDHHLTVAADEPDVVIDLTYVSTGSGECLGHSRLHPDDPSTR